MTTPRRPLDACVRCVACQPPPWPTAWRRDRLASCPRGCPTRFADCLTCDGWLACWQLDAEARAKEAERRKKEAAERAQLEEKLKMAEKKAEKGEYEIAALKLDLKKVTEEKEELVEELETWEKGKREASSVRQP